MFLACGETNLLLTFVVVFLATLVRAENVLSTGAVGEVDFATTNIPRMPVVIPQAFWRIASCAIRGLLTTPVSETILSACAGVNDGFNIIIFVPAIGTRHAY